jgi:hypothetical protein
MANDESPKVPQLFSNPNKLKELLEDLEAYETRKKDDLLFNSINDDNGSRMVIIKSKDRDHIADALPDTYKDDKAYKEPIELENVRRDRGMEVKKEVRDKLEKIREEAPFAGVTDLPDLEKAASAFDDVEAFKIIKG